MHLSNEFIRVIIKYKLTFEINIITNVYSQEKCMSIICLHEDMKRIEGLKRNRKQFVSSGSETANIEIDHEITFFSLG